MTNYELDVAIEDPAFADTMAAQYERDLAYATEIVLTPRKSVRKKEPPPTPEGDAAGARRAMAGSAGRAAAGAVSVGSALGAALTNRRTLGPTEGGPLAAVAIVMVGIAIVAALFPRVLAWPIALLAGWLGIAWAWKGWTLWRRRGSTEPAREAERPVAPPSGEPRS
jgi:cardiolipin synthase